MARKPTPPPEPQNYPGCAVATGVYTVLVILFAVIASPWVSIGLIVPSVFLAVAFHDRLLLQRAQEDMGEHGILGVLVTSDSPNWRDYIADRWLPRIRNRLIVLNWSQRRHWPKSTPHALFQRFVGTNDNYCPSVVVLRELQHPLVFRFFYAFRDAKHGNREALEKLEARLWEELEARDRSSR